MTMKVLLKHKFDLVRLMEVRGNDALSKNFENFNQLFLNIMTRMNVLFSRYLKREF